MEFLFQIARYAHMIGGFVALFIFWVPIVTRKGGKVHRGAGWVYVASMSAVSITALFMGIYRLTWDAGTEPGAIPFSWFLIFIAILSGATAWYGVRVLRYKKRKKRNRALSKLLLPIFYLSLEVAV